LSNASLDVAFHDKFINNYVLLGLRITAYFGFNYDVEIFKNVLFFPQNALITLEENVSIYSVGAFLIPSLQSNFAKFPVASCNRKLKNLFSPQLLSLQGTKNFCSKITQIKNDTASYTEQGYIEQFFVGLLEGDGTITTNINSSSQTIRVRIVIALKNDNNNHIMLKKIQKIVGGRVVIERKDKYVT
jgi:hypothetical protein